MLYHLEWAFLLGFLALIPFILLMTVYKDSSEYSSSDAVIASIVAVVICFSTFYFALGTVVNDVEVRSGQVTQKKREHDTYTTTESCGEKTCTKTMYRVRWYVITNVGEKKIDEKTSSSSWVYSSKDPKRYQDIVIGEPAALEFVFRNYVMASPKSLFGSRVVEDRYKTLVKNYPQVVYDIYRADRVMLMGNAQQNKAEWNKILSEKHREWGIKRKVNLMMIFVDESDANLGISIKNHWIQGKQNDLVVVFGLDKNNVDILWTDVFGWNENELMKINLKNDLKDLKNLTDKEAVIKVIDDYLPLYKNRDMEKDFKYLEADIKPQWWWLIVTIVLYVFAALLAIAWKQKHFNHRFNRNLFSENYYSVKVKKRMFR